MFLFNGAAVSWNVRKQPTVALSTTEAEYMALAAALQEGIWLKQLYTELIGPLATVQIQCDNKGALDLASDSKYHARSKHIDVRNHFIREKISDGTVSLNYVNTSEMVADMFTKAIIPCKLKQFSNNCGIKF